MPGSLEGRVAIVTGAGQGMGQAFARALAAEGAMVAIAELDPGTGEAAAAEIRDAGLLATAYRVDVRERAQIQALIDDLVARHGRIDILVNNAGLAAGGPSEDVTDQDWERVYGVMLKGLFLCSQIAGRVMIGQGRGVILNICSMAGIGGWAKRALYTPAKAGAIALTQVLGVEWARHGIRVVGISPGQVETPLNEVVFKAGLADRETFTNRAPMRRFASPEEIADAVVFLVSDAASGITAEVVTIDGGWIAWGGIEEPVGVWRPLAPGDHRRVGPIRPGSGTPFTHSGRSIGYRPPPWRMRGRALALWYRLVDPSEARRHVPPGVEMDADPVVRARFWDLEHDAAGPAEDAHRPHVWTPIREAVVAFPVRYGHVEGDLPTYMYANDFIYTAMGRELMGWPVRDALIELDPQPETGPAAGMAVHARMVRAGTEIMRASLTVTGEMTTDRLPTPPRWLAEKVIGRVDRPGAAIAQLVATGPERIDRRDLWEATATLSFADAPGDELSRLAPREIVRAQYWANLELTVGWGEVLAELGDGVYDRG